MSALMQSASNSHTLALGTHTTFSLHQEEGGRRRGGKEEKHKNHPKDETRPFGS